MSKWICKIKRIYETPNQSDGLRVLVDRIWPRGISKEKAKIDIWMKEVAPSDKLRKWFNHDPNKWLEFKKRYFKELNQSAAIYQLTELAKNHPITLVYSAKDQKHNQAVALLEFLEMVND
jgi:uncharacterized protein YeaO (DUF488 family)